VSMMVALKVMACFKISLSTRNWDRAFFMAVSQLTVSRPLALRRFRLKHSSPFCCFKSEPNRPSFLSLFLSLDWLHQPFAHPSGGKPRSEP
ncbi:hypothetical protein ACV1DR_21555, partial [Aeromonas jandaei]